MQKTIKITKLDHCKDPFTKIQFAQKGDAFFGYFIKEPVEGERFNLKPIKNHPNYRGISTSGVQEILSSDTFCTYNSIYQWQEVEIPIENAN